MEHIWNEFLEVQTVFRDKNFTFSQKRRTDVTRNKQTRELHCTQDESMIDFELFACAHNRKCPKNVQMKNIYKRIKTQTWRKLATRALYAMGKYMFKVNNKDVRITFMETVYSIIIVNFEQVFLCNQLNGKPREK